MTAATGAAPTEVAAWMDAAVAGDRDAYGHLYQRYRPVVYRFIKVRVGNPQTADDLTADTFTKALTRIHTFTWQGRDPGAWFITIARNRVADHFKAGARREFPVDFAPALDPSDPTWWIQIADDDTAAQPEDATLRHLDAVEIHAAVTSLTGDQRDCLTYRYLHGLSVTETAHVMGRHVGAVKALSYRAVRSAERVLRDRDRRWAEQHATPAVAPPSIQPHRQEQVPVIPQPREPLDDEPLVDELPTVAEPGERRILWRCRDCHRSYARPYLTHGAPDSCQGWLEPIEVTR